VKLELEVMSKPLPIHPSRVHPLTGAPLQAIGFRPNGTPLWPIMGGDDTPKLEDWSTTFEGKTPEQVKQALEAALAKSSTADSWANVFTGQKPEDVKTKLDHARTWEQRAGTNKAKADAYDGLVTQLGITPTPDPDDPDKDKPVSQDEVNRRVADEQAKNKATRIEVAVLRNAPAGVSGVALVDSREFMEKASALDPDADDFTTKLTEAITTATTGDAGVRFRVVGNGRPTPDPRRGLQSDGGVGTTETGRTTYKERKEAGKVGNRIAV
jgi:hypothetical protein